MVQDYESDDENDVVDLDTEKIFSNYSGDAKDLDKIQSFLQSGCSICSICIQNVKRRDSIWSCKSCYCIYHLTCIQKWANNSLAQKKIYAENQPTGYYNNLGQYVEKKKIDIVWDCPQCRSTFQESEIPRYYECFCGKEINPSDQNLWQIPHSCGETCRKNLNCGHFCNLICHPGPCPSCPQMIQKSCQCGKSPARMTRCSKKEWTCGKVCKLQLSCGKHNCEGSCHAVCPPCQKLSLHKCSCGAKSKEVRCDKSIWSCGKLCGKLFPCGVHKCEKKCHTGSCGDCPKGWKTCGCGKSKEFGDCTESTVESCGDTCQKILNCGIHRCLERCHKGPCPSCLATVEKSCRCGKIKKEILCSKTFTCETKCKNMRPCMKHPCSRKCCDGNCPPCDKICNKTLTCGKHKCQETCGTHSSGSCYPCSIKIQLKCPCGGTVISVYCGREKKTKIPKCKLPCKIPSKCHHTNAHKCHEGDCPKCVQVCNLPNNVSNCKHLCQAVCHDYVKVVKKSSVKPAVPWETDVEKVEMKKIDHPICQVPVEVTCLGNHETILKPCSNAVVTSCGRQCGRKLKCGNHLCQLECHLVIDSSSDQQDENCESCNENCSIERPQGCVHPCPKNYCHPAPCKRCIVQVKAKCFCGLTDVYYRCCDFNKNGLTVDQRELLKEKLFSCGNRCMKMYECGHRCTATCHNGICPNAEDCKQKVKVYCKCKNRRVDINCYDVRKKQIQVVECDKNCEEKRKIEAERELEKQKEQLRLEEEKNRKELEEFEKRFGKKKPRERKQRVYDDTTNKKDYKLILISGLIVVAANIVYFVFFN